MLDSHRANIPGEIGEKLAREIEDDLCRFLRPLRPANGPFENGTALVERLTAARFRVSGVTSDAEIAELQQSAQALWTWLLRRAGIEGSTIRSYAACRPADDDAEKWYREPYRKVVARLDESFGPSARKASAAERSRASILAAADDLLGVASVLRIDGCTDSGWV